MYLLVLFSFWVISQHAGVVGIPVKVTVKLQEQQNEEPSLAKVDCPNCAKKDQVEKVRIEGVKRTILDKLRMTDRPSGIRPLKVLPEPLRSKYGGLFAQDKTTADQKDELYYAKTREVVTFADSVRHCGQSNRSVCFSVQLQQQLDTNEVKSAQLFIKNVLPGRAFSVYDIRHQSEPHLVSASASEEESWISFDVTVTISTKLDESIDSSVLIFQVNCPQCGDFLHAMRKDLPFIEMKTQEVVERSRRSVQRCTEDSSHCCKGDFWVSFEEIGWDDWILSPKGYWANYCSGSCEGRFDLLEYQHTQVKMLLPQRDETDTIKASTCCSPTKLSELSILILNPDGVIFQKDLPDMSVEACGCA